MSLSLNFNQIKPLIEVDSLILTPNSRTQNAIIAGQLTEPSVDSVLEIVKVSSVNQWIDALWGELSFHLALPKRISSLVITSWLEKEISKEKEWTLTNPSGVANKALEAYKNLCQWGLDLYDLEKEENNHSLEVEYFIKWLRTFEEFCTQNQLMADFLSLNYINNNIKKLAGILPKHILMVGFGHFTPLEKSFFNNLEVLGVTANKYNYKIEKTNSKQISFSCLREEIEFAACYAKEFVEKKEQQGDRKSNKSSNKNGVIGIVVEQLVSNLGEVHAAFSREFHPQESKPWVDIQKPDYNVSAGFSLAEQPLIVAALTILNLNSYQIGRDELHFLKNTPFIHWRASNSIHNSDRYIRQFLHQQCLSPRKIFTINYLLKKIEEHELRNELQSLAAVLKNLSNPKKGKGNINEHIEDWNSRLSSWNWLGLNIGQEENNLNEFEIKACQELFDAIEQTKEIDHIAKQLSFSEALRFLNQQVINKSFQIASDHSSVQVLGVLEASGLQFDELLMVGFNANNWPQKNKINPFLPLTFQRQYNMPGNSAQRELDYAKVLSAGFLNAAKKIIVTSNNEATNQLRNESSFFSSLERLPETEVSTISKKPSKEVTQTTRKYDWVRDSTIDLSDASKSGGAYLLSSYAKCPFRAIASFQLKLNDYPEQDPGIEAKAKGLWLHDSLEIIWGRLKTKQKLLLQSPLQLSDLISTAIDLALLKHQDFFAATTQATLVEIEKQKLFTLISEWLLIEKNRDEFVIDALEKEYHLPMGSLSFRFRIDRVDRITSSKSLSEQNKRLEIIDYKSGRVNINDWFGVRPTEAQMPAYVLAIENELELSCSQTEQDTSVSVGDAINDSINGLSYAQIKTGDASMYGLVFLSSDPAEHQDRVMKKELSLEKNKTTAIKDISENNYRSLVKDWQTTLQRISTGITVGWIPVSPKNDNSCLYCDYGSICRIDENQPCDSADNNISVGEP